MKYDIDKDVIRKVVKLMGDKSLVIAMEECSELAQSLSKVFRGKPDINNVIEEIADVLICIEEVMYKEGIPPDKIQKLIDYKLDRLEKRIKNKKLT